jgi:hypothetical protein
MTRLGRRISIAPKEVLMKKLPTAILAVVALVAGLLVALKPRKAAPPPRPRIPRLHVPFV